MDYVVGSVAALISGDVTPNRPRLIRRALTPTKHQPSPNVTPKSEFVDDRSIFLSPSLQKKKAIVKKSPKRIFDNPDLDVTNDGEGNSFLLSPKADKVKKHLKEELDADEKANMSPKSSKSPKKGKGNLDKSVESKSSKKRISVSENDEENIVTVQNVNESTPKKKKKQRNYVSMPVDEEKENLTEQNVKTDVSIENNNISKKKRKSHNSTADSGTNVNKDENEGTPKKKQKNKISESHDTENTTEQSVEPKNNEESKQRSKKKKKKNKKGKNKAKTQNNKEAVGTNSQNKVTDETSQPSSPKKKNKKTINTVNPNAVTNKDSDSEHESDDEIQSDNEQTNNEILNTGPVESSEDEEEEAKKPQKQEKKDRGQEYIDDEVKRTLFVGNVPFSQKCRKEVKKIFEKYGRIETVRVRAVPVKDARVTPKVAVIKNKLHPERTTVNVYVKFENASSVDKALVENNTVLNSNHLRVSRSDTRGSEHDPLRAIFVGNLPFAIEDDTLRNKFQRCGEVTSVRVIRDAKTGAGKGFGYVNFESKDAVELALAMSEEDLTIKNSILRVKRCTDTNKKHPKPGNQEKYQGNRNQNAGRSQGMKKRNQQGNQGFRRNHGNFRNQEGNSQGFGRGQGNFGRSQGFGRQGNEDRSLGEDGAQRRMLMKRHNEEGGGPPNKRPNIKQPAKEKKPRKEFVGMTAEKKKKHKFNKGDKKKKALSEILTKYS